MSTRHDNEGQPALFLCMACGMIHARGACEHDRKYQLTKVGAGDWLLPSNDARTLWRLHKGTDGWGAWHRPMPHRDAELDALVEEITLGEWDGWQLDGTLDTRTQAITYALAQRP